MTYADITKIIVESTSIERSKFIVRQSEIDLLKVLYVNKPIKVITGLRRSGKSFILKRIYQALLENIPQSNILYLNFENELLASNLDLKSLREIYEIFYSGRDTSKSFYIFFDEIQNVPKWEKFIRTIYDSTDHNIWITGSNSHLLSKEFATVLGGRVLEYEIFPFAFTELLEFNDIKIKNHFDLNKNSDQVLKYFNEYLSYGGIAELFELEPIDKLSFRKSLIDKIVINDILKRYNIDQPNTLKNIILYLESNIGNVISARNIEKAANINVGTVISYLEYISNTFMTYELIKFSYKTKEILNSQKKYYFVDNIFSSRMGDDYKLENLVFQTLLKKYSKENVFFGRDDKGYEIDFIVKKDDEFEAVQVCYELNEDNFKRESRSLKLFNEYNNKKIKSKIITIKNKIDEKVVDGIEITNIIEELLPALSTSKS